MFPSHSFQTSETIVLSAHQPTGTAVWVGLPRKCRRVKHPLIVVFLSLALMKKGSKKICDQRG